MRKLPAGSADLVFADPPYNLQLKQPLLRPNHSRVNGFCEDWDKFESLASYDSFTRASLEAARRIMKKNATIFVIGSYHNIFRLGAILQDLGFWILNDIIWRKANPMPNFRGRRFTNAHETIIWAAKCKTSRYVFNYRLLKAGNDDCQPRSDWFLPLCTGAERLKDGSGRKLHPTQKPESLISRIILAASNPGDLVLDPFTGSGTTAAAARKLRRSFIGIERDPAYVQAARERAAAVTPPPPGALPIAAPDASTPRIALATLIEAGLIQPGEILRDASGRHSATVQAGGAISAGAGVGSIHKISALVQNLPACNGWTFWHCERSGALTPIGTLRTRLHERLAEAAE